MACRYVPMVAALGASVILEVQPPLASLLKCLEGVTKLIARGDEIPDFDVHCPLMSLPLAFKTRLETIPAKVPYVTVPKKIIEQWRSRLGESGFKIGVAWAGSPDFVDDRDRSIQLRNILSVFSVCSARYFNIQKDLRDGDQEILNAHPQIVQVRKRDKRVSGHRCDHDVALLISLARSLDQFGSCCHLILIGDGCSIAMIHLGIRLRGCLGRQKQVSGKQSSVRSVHSWKKTSCRTQFSSCWADVFKARALAASAAATSNVARATRVVSARRDAHRDRHANC